MNFAKQLFSLWVVVVLSYELYILLIIQWFINNIWYCFISSVCVGDGQWFYQTPSFPVGVSLQFSSAPQLQNFHCQKLIERNRVKHHLHPPNIDFKLKVLAESAVGKTCSKRKRTLENKVKKGKEKKFVLFLFREALVSYNCYWL